MATTNEDGTPAVSPKAIFVVVDEPRIAFGNIRSPGTVANIRARPDVEVNFIDVLARRVVRVKDRAEIAMTIRVAGTDHHAHAAMCRRIAANPRM